MRITDENSARNMFGFVENYQCNEHSLLAYLATVGKNSQQAYYYQRQYKNELGLTEEECENNIVDAIKEQLDL